MLHFFHSERDDSNDLYGMASNEGCPVESPCVPKGERGPLVALGSGVVLLLLLGAFASAARATTIYVTTAGADANDGLSWGAAKGTVGGGLAAAVEGDQVWVAGGTYVGCIPLKSGVELYGGFAGAETELGQRDWTTQVTVLDGNQAGSVVTAPPGATAGTRIDGFTIRNGSGTLLSGTGYGGGIYCSNSSPTVANNTIMGNSAGTYGGGIYCGSGSSPLILNNVITDNSSGSIGGGISCASASPTILRNRITGNTAAVLGGGICHSGASSSLTIVNNTLAGNVANLGAGVYCTLSSSIVILNNTIVGNAARYSDRGGGICCAGSLAISNNIVAFNTSGIVALSGAPVLRNNCVYNPDGYDYSGVSAGTGDLSADPQLVGAAFGQAHLATGSPCIDAGLDSAVQTGWVDMDGEPRIQGPHVDIGADEFNGTAPSLTPRVVRVSPSGSDANDGSSWALAKRTVQAGIDAACAASGEVWVAAGVYNQRIILRTCAYAYGGFAGTEDSRDQRDWTANLTVLDGQAGGSVVSAFSGYRISGIDGFTIRNGKAPSGAGICCSGGSPVIANNVITGNTTDHGWQTQFSYGAGIYCLGSSPLIVNNTITGNAANNAYGPSYGGGIYCSSSSPTISNNTISGNVAHSSHYDYGCGGGICCLNSSPTVLNNRIKGNTAISTGLNGTGRADAVWGGGLYFSGSSSVVANNTIAGNTAAPGDYLGTGGGGGGIYCYQSSVVVSNNTIVGNTGGDGGGVYCDQGAPSLWNNLVAHNSSGICQTVDATPALHRNCVYNPAGYNYSGLAPGAGDISADPQLPGVEFGEFRLASNSPCVDAGDDVAVQANWTDMDGEARIQGAHVDIGADEFNGTTPVYTPAIVRVSTSGSDSNDGSNWTLAKRTVQGGIDAASAIGGEVWVAQGTYYERINLKPWAPVYGGFVGTEDNRGQRDWRNPAAILDAEAAGPVVSALPGSGFCRIDGFTIRNGKGTLAKEETDGGGVYCSGAWPVIANNTITENINAGIQCQNGSPVVLNNRITGNVTDGIYCSGGSPTISNNVIARNSGRGLYYSSFDPRQQGAAEGSAVIANNTIAGNALQGVYAYSASSIVNNIVAFNSSGIEINMWAEGITWRNNCVYNPAGANYVGGDPGPGDISADPELVDLEYFRDLRLQAGSPCIDAGNNAAAIAAGLLTDLDGHGRFVDDPAKDDCTAAPDTCGTAPVVDMGAYEFIPGDYDRDGDVDLDDLAGLQACWSGPGVAYAGDCVKADFDRDGDVDMDDFGVLQRCFSGPDRPVNPTCGG